MFCLVVAAFENSQSDTSALGLIRNSKHAEDSLGVNPSSSPVKSPYILDNAPHLTLEGPMAGSVFLNHHSTPLPPVEEGNGTPETPGTVDDLKLLPEEPQISALLESLPPQPDKQKEAPGSQEDGLETPGEAYHDASATPLPVQVSGVSRRSRAKVFVFVCVLVLALIFMVFETESLTPLLSLAHLESLRSHLRFNYYIPVRRFISFW